MFALVSRYKEVCLSPLVNFSAVLFFLTAILLNSALVYSEPSSLGKAATAEEIQGWDIDIRPDGTGLPDGSGNAFDGEDVFIEKCALCHGEFAEGAGRYPALAGGEGTLDTHDPMKTVGSYWPYATTLFDYIRRAMPYGHAQSLSNDEIYEMTAYILYSSDIIEDDLELNKETLPLVVMPNRDGFIADNRPSVPDGEPCMKNCLQSPATIIGKAAQIGVTPEDTVDSNLIKTDSDQVTVSEAFSRGKTVFKNQCALCHSMNDMDAKIGPSLHALIGRNSGADGNFGNYSNAITSASITWSRDTLKSFLSAPQQFLPGTNMPFAGIQDAAELDDLLEYLGSAVGNN